MVGTVGIGRSRAPAVLIAMSKFAKNRNNKHSISTELTGNEMRVAKKRVCS
jgi:hypothetical protein